MLKKDHGAAVYNIEEDLSDVSAKLTKKDAILKGSKTGIAAKSVGLKNIMSNPDLLSGLTIKIRRI